MGTHHTLRHLLPLHLSSMPSAPQIDAPLTLWNLFPSEDSEEEGEAVTEDVVEFTSSIWDPCFEIQSVELVGQQLKIRQFAFHSHNANRVWPGTFNLAEYLLRENANVSKDDEVGASSIVQPFWGSVLELGTATGLLAIRLALASTSNYSRTEQGTTRQELRSRSFCSHVVTSDVQDEHGDIADNVKFNFELNGFNDASNRPLHIPHTWGTGWRESVARQLNNCNGNGNSNMNVDDFLHFDTIVASDILLYVSAYDALVETLSELMPKPDVDNQASYRSDCSKSTRFVMSWNRRMKDSAKFFDKMKQAGFDVKHEGKCIYTFLRVSGQSIKNSVQHEI